MSNDLTSLHIEVQWGCVATGTEIQSNHAYHISKVKGEFGAVRSGAIVVVVLVYACEIFEKETALLCLCNHAHEHSVVGGSKQRRDR